MIILASLLMFLQPAAGELQFVVGLVYAGDTPPFRLPYPNDLNELEVGIYPRGIGRLTEVGVKRVYELGRWMRRRYVTDHQLIPPNFSMPEVSIESSSFIAAIESGECLMAGLFPDGANSNWLNDSLRSSRPIPVLHSTGGERDVRLRPLTDKCDSFVKETRFEEEEFRERFDAENVEWYERLEEDTGFTRFNSRNIEMLFDVEKEMAQGLPQPAWLNQSHNGVTALQWIRESYRKLAVFKVASEKRARFAAGVLLNEWLDLLARKASRRAEKMKAKFSITRFTPQMAMRSAMKIHIDELPMPGSIFLVELHKTLKGIHAVQILSRSASGEVRLHKLPKCGLPCPLDDFLRILAPMRLTYQEREKLCSSSPAAMLGTFVLFLVTFMFHMKE